MSREYQRLGERVGAVQVSGYESVILHDLEQRVEVTISLYFHGGGTRDGGAMSISL